MIKMNVRAYKEMVLLIACFLSVILNGSPLIAQEKNDKPLRLAVVGITHGHVPWILGRKDKTDVSLVGIYETDTALSHLYASQYHLDKDLFYTNLDKMLNVVKPEATPACQHLSDGNY